MSTNYIGYYYSPVGTLEIKADDTHIKSLDFVDDNNKTAENLNSIIITCLTQLEEYFSKARTKFDLPLAPDGTEFQKNVWNELMNVPYGTIKTYKDVATAINNPKAVRAVGGANNKNPIPLIIPCHRIIGASGKLVGYGGGIWRKEWLLNHEDIKYIK